MHPPAYKKVYDVVFECQYREDAKDLFASYSQFLKDRQASQLINFDTCVFKQFGEL